MNTFLRLALTLGTAATALAAAAVQPDRPTLQTSAYDGAAGTVTFQVKMPTVTVYDEYYIQYPLDHIDQFIIERRFQGGTYESFAVVASVDNPEVGAIVTATDPEVAPSRAYEYKFSVIVDGEKGQSDYLQFFSAPVPAPITDFKAVPAAGDTPSVTLTLTAPTLDTGSLPLESLTSVVIEKSIGMFETEEVKVFSPVSPGDALTFTDTDVETGKTYYYRAYSLTGQDCRSERTPEVKVFVGDDVPGTPSNLVATATGENEVTLVWDAPTAGANGGIFDPAAVEYGIYRKFWDSDSYELVKGGVKGNTYTDEPGFIEESLVQYCLLAVNAAGECPVTLTSNEVLVGRPATYPFTESFAFMTLEHKGWTRTSTYTDPYYTPVLWTLHENKTMFYWPTDEYLPIEPVDGDQGMAVAYFYSYQEPGTVHSLTSPRIAMEKARTPQLTFHYFETCREATENRVRVQVKASDETEWNQVYESVILDEVEPDWREVTVDLPQYAGKEWINIRFDAVRGGNNIVDLCLDGIKLIDKAPDSITGTESTADETILGVYAIDGKQVLGHATETDLRRLAKGTYIVKTDRRSYKLAL